ncbi:MAG: LamG-like jellyroll fold domain-containing protein [Armatimonadota bacterium]
MLYTIIIINAFACVSSSDTESAENSKLIGYWKLQGDCTDHSGAGNNGVNHNVDLSDGNSAGFKGTDSCIEIPNSHSLELGKGDFSISAWIKCESGARVVGDIVSKFDSKSRTGLNFHIPSSASGHSSVSDTRNILFGIDAGVEGQWEDCGRPVESNSLISALIVYKNHLYAGIADTSRPEDACHIFRYDGVKKWVDCGRVSDDLDTPSIYSTVIHNGVLYAGTGKWDYANLQTCGKAEVYRYMGGTRWQKCGTFSKGKRILTLASMDGILYATDDAGASYRRESDDNWVYIGSPISYKYCGAMIYRGKLFAGASTTIDRFNGIDGWDTVGNFDVKQISQIYSFGVYQGKLYVGTWPDGLLMRYDTDGKWTDCGWVGSPDKTDLGGGNISHINEVNSLIVYNGSFYSGVIPKGEVCRYDGGQKNTLIKNLVNNAEYHVTKHDSWSRVPCMAIYKGYLYAGTSSARGITIENQKCDTGKVFRWKTGECVSYDDDIGVEWRHITAIRDHGKLKLYLDGKLVSESDGDSPVIDISNANPLMIGFGQQNYFTGRMKNIRLYSGALSDNEVNEIFKKAL